MTGAGKRLYYEARESPDCRVGDERARKTSPKVIYFLLGEEELLARKWLEENLDKWVEEAWRPFNYHHLEGKSFSLENFSGLIQSFPMGSANRVVMVSGIDQIESSRRKRVPELARAAVETTILLFSFVPSPPDLKKLSLTKEWDDLTEKGELVKFSLKKEEKGKWLDRSLKEMNVKLTREAEIYLMEASGGDLARLEHELEKISDSSAPIQKSDLEMLVSKSENVSMFTLLDGIGERKGSKALSALKSLLEQGEPPLRILATIGGQVRLYWQIKTLLGEKKSQAEIAKILKVHPFRVTKGIDHARNFKEGELPRFADWLVRADWNIKTGKQDPQHVLELILARVCA